MRVIPVKVYKFEELSDGAKEKAKQDYAAAFGFGYSDEAFASLKKLAEHFGGKLENYEVDFFAATYSQAHFDMPEMSRCEIRKRLKNLGPFDPKTLKGLGECKLTGCCTDEYGIDGFRAAFYNGETDLQKLMQAAFKSWLKACQADAEDEYTNETFAEHCQANEYEFYENGEAYA